jgi:hypothetical protein
MVTDRDMKAVEFVEAFGAAALSHVARAVFGSGKGALDVARHRMKVLTDERLVKRYRTDMNAEYVYYAGAKAPHRQDHHLQLAALYTSILGLTGAVETWQREPLWGGLRPDAYCVYRGKKRIHFAVEIERNTNPFNQQKYESFLASGDYRKLFPSFPWVLIVSAKPIKIATSNIRYIVIPPSLDGIENIFREV